MKVMSKYYGIIEVDVDRQGIICLRMLGRTCPAFKVGVVYDGLLMFMELRSLDLTHEGIDRLNMPHNLFPSHYEPCVPLLPWPKDHSP